MVCGPFDQCPAGGDERHVQLQRFDQRQRAAVAAPGGQHDFDASPPGLQHGLAGRVGQFVATVDERAVDVNGEQAIAGHAKAARRMRTRGRRRAGCNRIDPAILPGLT